MTARSARASIGRVRNDDLELLDDSVDDFVFEPNGWDMAVEIGLRLELELDREALDELADAVLVWADEPVLERLTDAAFPRVWNEELEAGVREGLERLATRSDWRVPVTAALAELDRDPPSAEVAREVVRHLAMQVGQVGTPFFFCLDCIDELVKHAPPDDRRSIAIEAAVATVRNATGVEGTPAQRAAVRAQLGRLGELGRDSVRSLAAELRLIAAEPLPQSPDDDDVWEVVYARLIAETLRPELN